jgi:hypothetical protein
LSLLFLFFTKEFEMTVERYIRIMAGFVVMLSLALGVDKAAPSL